MKYYSIIALGICGTLSAMEYAHENAVRIPSSSGKLGKVIIQEGYPGWAIMMNNQDLLIKMPSSGKLNRAFIKEGYAAWAMNSQFSKTFGNKVLSVRGLEGCLKVSLKAHNNAYTQEQLTVMTHKYMDIIYNTLMTDHISAL